MPLERVEAQICELAGHLAAATCRFLVLLADFDARRGWASWEMTSCAAWLSWKCQMSSGTAREHVRVARALRELPVIRGEFAAGRLSYAKVRALTRIATPATEAGLAEIAGPMTGNQLERFARAHRQVTHADDAAARIRRRLVWRFEEDGSLSGSFRLPPLAGAVMLKALRAACADPDGPHAAGHADVSAETPAAAQTPDAGAGPAAQTSSSLADALVAIAEAFLAGKVAGADDAEVYQVMVHVGADAVTAGPGGDVSAETPTAAGPAPGDPAGPADPARCHVEDGPAVSVSTAQMLGCGAVLSWMRHACDGSVLALGRRRRRPNAAQRRAARERDQGRCRFPGCQSRRTDLHHVVHWANGGRTDLAYFVVGAAPLSPVSCVPATQFCMVLASDTSVVANGFQAGNSALVTTDAGRTWTGYATLPSTFWVGAVSCVSASVCWASGTNAQDGAGSRRDHRRRPDVDGQVTRGLGHCHLVAERHGLRLGHDLLAGRAGLDSRLAKPRHG
jgi:hypothetical protein